MKRPIYRNSNDNVQANGLDVALNLAWIGQTLSRDDQGIVRFPALQDSQKGMAI